MRWILTVTATLGGLGCSNKWIPPSAYPEPAPVVLAIPRDSLWPAIVETVADYKLAVKTIDRQSGLLQTEQMSSFESTWWDCGSYPNPTWSNYREVQPDLKASITITATPVGADSTRVRVVSNLNAVVACRSRGVVEKQMVEGIAKHSRAGASRG